jgi:hypothetical protein
LPDTFRYLLKTGKYPEPLKIGGDRKVHDPTGAGDCKDRWKTISTFTTKIILNPWKALGYAGHVIGRCMTVELG